jgi:hypothetical protein
MLGSGINGAVLIAAGTVDRGLEPKGGYLGECREGQRLKHPARLEAAGSQLRINFLPSVLAAHAYRGERAAKAGG